MTKDDIICIAREAGLHIATDVNWMPIIGFEYAVKFAELVASAEREASVGAFRALNDTYELELRKAIATEREACAKLCKELAPSNKTMTAYKVLHEASKAIQLRGRE